LSRIGLRLTARLRQQIDPGLPSPLRLIMPLWLPSHYSAEPDLLCTGIR